MFAVALLSSLFAFAPVSPTKVAEPRPATKPATKPVPKPVLDVRVREVLSRLGEPVSLTKAERTQLTVVVAALKEAGSTSPVAAPEAWSTAVESWARRTQSVDVMLLVQWVLRQAYLDSNEDLAAYAAKVAYFNEMKKRVRDHARQVRSQVADKKGSTKVTVRALTIRPKFVPGRRPVFLAAKVTHTVDEWQVILAGWDDQLQSVGDDAQLANIDLQNHLQKQQQTIQMLSNVSKVLHDTALAVIRKIG